MNYRRSRYKTVSTKHQFAYNTAMAKVKHKYDFKQKHIDMYISKPSCGMLLSGIWRKNDRVITEPIVLKCNEISNSHNAV